MWHLIAGCWLLVATAAGAVHATSSEHQPPPAASQPEATLHPQPLSELFPSAAAMLSASTSTLTSTAANCAFAPNYDLSALAVGDLTFEPPNQSISYALSVCGRVKESTCAAVNGALCQYSIPPATKPKMIAIWDGSGVWTQLDSTNINKGVQVVFNNGDKCASGCTSCTPIPTQVTIQFTCVLGGDDMKYLIANMGDSCHFLLTMANNAGCPGGGSPPPNKDGGGGGGLSNGSLFTILFFVFSFVYVAGGCVYKRHQKEKTGLDACPNIDFWRELPGLVKDGFVFTFQKIRECTSGGGGGSGVSGASTDTYGTIK